MLKTKEGTAKATERKELFEYIYEKYLFIIEYFILFSRTRIWELLP